MNDLRLTRRAFLLASGATLGGLAAACAGNRQVPIEPAAAASQGPGASATSPAPTATEHATPTPSPGSVLRLAHLTDMHVDPGEAATAGFARALRHVHALRPRVDAILNTGDCILESLFADRSSTQAQWDAFHSVLDAELALPIFH